MPVTDHPGRSPSLADCGLFSKLPAEIRREIYQYFKPRKGSINHEIRERNLWQPYRGSESNTLAFMRTNRFIFGEVSHEIYHNQTLRFKIHPLDDRWVPIGIKTKPRHLRHTRFRKFKKLRIDVFAPNLKDRGQVHQLRDSAIDLVCVLCGHQSLLERAKPAYSTFDQQLLLHSTVDDLTRSEAGQTSFTSVERVTDSWVTDPSANPTWHPIRRPTSPSEVLKIGNMGLPEDWIASLPPGDWIVGGLPPIELVMHDSVKSTWATEMPIRELLWKLPNIASNFRSPSIALYPFTLLRAFCGVKMKFLMLDNKGNLVSSNGSVIEYFLKCGPSTWDWWGEWIWKQHEITMELEGVLDILDGPTANRLRLLRFQYWPSYQRSLHYLFIHLRWLKNRDNLLLWHKERLEDYIIFKTSRQAQDRYRRSMAKLHEDHLNGIANTRSDSLESGRE
ncbi:MAG: hypothetical protein Q9182_004650 [Xanthomendoza sp. 2 TL-2023]